MLLYFFYSFYFVITLAILKFSSPVYFPMGSSPQSLTKPPRDGNGSVHVELNWSVHDHFLGLTRNMLINQFRKKIYCVYVSLLKSFFLFFNCVVFFGVLLQVFDEDRNNGSLTVSGNTTSQSSFLRVVSNLDENFRVVVTKCRQIFYTGKSEPSEDRPGKTLRDYC